MKVYKVEWVRVEHQVWEFEVTARNEDEARDKAREFSLSAAFNDMANDYKVVHAEEFVNDVEEV